MSSRDAAYRIRALHSTTLRHADLVRGGSLRFVMGTDASTAHVAFRDLLDAAAPRRGADVQQQPPAHAAATIDGIDREAAIEAFREQHRALGSKGLAWDLQTGERAAARSVEATWQPEHSEAAEEAAGGSISLGLWCFFGAALSGAVGRVYQGLRKSGRAARLARLNPETASRED